MKTAALRHKIFNFKQKTDEPFYDAWERYKEYRRECPHHGFEDDYILEVFYDGVSYEFRNALDSLSNGDFMTQNNTRRTRTDRKYGIELTQQEQGERSLQERK